MAPKARSMTVSLHLHRHGSMWVQGLAISSRTARHRPTRRARRGKRCWHHQSNDSDCPAGPHPGKTNHLHWSCHRQRWRSPPCRSRRKQKTRNSRRRGCSIEPQKCFTAMTSPQESAGSLEPSTCDGPCEEQNTPQQGGGEYRGLLLLQLLSGCKELQAQDGIEATKRRPCRWYGGGDSTGYVSTGNVTRSSSAGDIRRRRRRRNSLAYRCTCARWHRKPDQWQFPSISTGMAQCGYRAWQSRVVQPATVRQEGPVVERDVGITSQTIQIVRSSPRKDQPPTLELPPPKMEIPSLQVTKEAENTELEKAGLFNRTPKVLHRNDLAPRKRGVTWTKYMRWALRRTKHSATGRWRISWPLTTPTPQWLQRTPSAGWYRSY